MSYSSNEPTTTKSYVLSSYDGGTIKQTHTNLTVGDIISYTIVPDAGFKIKLLELYRFDTPTLSDVYFSRATKVANLDFNDPKYTVTKDDLGKSLCVKAEFEKLSCNIYRHIVEHGNIYQTTTLGYLNDTVTYTVEPDRGYTAGAITMYRFKEPEIHGLDLTKGTVIATLKPDYNGRASYKVTTDDLGHAIIAVPSYSKATPEFTGEVNDYNGQVKYTVKGNTVTITPDNNLKFYSLTGSVVRAKYGAGRPETINATIDNNVATLIIPNAYLNNRHAILSLSYKFIKTVESTGVTDDTKQNATVSVKNNTITITPDAGYNIISANLYTINPYDYYTHSKTNETSFKIENNIATLTFDNVQNLRNNYEIHVSYETKKQEIKPTVVKYTGLAIKPLENTTITFDGVNHWELKCNEGYHINDLHVLGSWVGSGEYNIKDTVTPTISSDKKIATFVVTDKSLLTNANLKITGDIAKDEIPPTPNTGTNVIRLYEVDDETLDKISKKDLTVFQNEAPQRYDFQSFINQLYKLPFAIPKSYLTTTNQIVTGYFTVDVPAYKINEQNYSLKIGSITVPTTNGFDYNIKDISLILPWLPTVKLSSSDILGKTINIVYNLSFLDGTTTVVIKSDNTVIESFQNNIAQNLELFNIYSNRENGSLNSTLQNDLRQAYIKINYYKPIDNLISYPTNEHGTLKDYHGYTKVKNIILSKSINADIDDLIINQLKQGVIINDTKRN